MKSKSYNATRSEVINAVKIAVKNLKLELKESDGKKGLMKVDYAGNLLSWGNNIEIKISKSITPQIKVAVSSSSKAQIVGWGVNDDLEENILREVSQILKAK